jgi:hypothetical protein
MRIFLSEIKKKIKKSLDDLAYAEDYDEIISILLLFNIETVIEDGAMEESRFPFQLYNKKDISIEHIHPQNPEKIDDKNAKEWLSSHLNSLQGFSNIQEEYKKLIEKIQTTLEDYKKEKFEEIFKVYNNLVKMEEQEHTLRNLALVGKAVNSTLNNSFFDKKRALIKKASKEHYIPICTRRVFKKYYTEYPADMTFWGKKDRDGYFEAIKRIYNKFVDSDFGESDE